MKIKIVIALLLTYFGATAETYKIENDISYSTDKNPYSIQLYKLDVYHPVDTTGLPVIVWFHGGGLPVVNVLSPKNSNSRDM